MRGFSVVRVYCDFEDTGNTALFLAALNASRQTLIAACEPIFVD